METKDSIPAQAARKLPPRPQRKPKVIAAEPLAIVTEHVAAPEPLAIVNEPAIEAAASPAILQDLTPAEPATLATPAEGTIEMATLASPTDATSKAQAMFGDMNERFKTAFEKSTKLGEEMVEFSKGNVEAFVASARIAAKGTEAIGQEAAEYSKKSLESAMAMFRSFAAVKSPTELFQLQSDYAKSSFDSAVAEASKLSESMLKIAGEAVQPLSSRYALAAEKIKTAAI